MNVLKTMRNMSSLKVLLWIIVISFVAAMFTVWGSGGGSGEGGRTWLGKEYAVKVGSRTLPPAVFRLQYRFYVERIKQMLGDSYREDFTRGASKTVANGMVSQLILADMAKDYGLMVSDQELAAGIQRIYGFKDPKTEYPALISRMGVTADEFQTLLRYELLDQKLSDLLADSVYLSDDELKRLYTEENEGAKAMVAVVSSRTFMPKVGTISDGEAQARYERDKASYQIPEKRGLEYIAVSPNSVRSTMKVDDAQVKAYYDSHKAEFTTPSTERRASHILIKVDEKAPASEVEAARKKAQDIYAKAKAGADFAALAKEFSQDGSAANGGDLGFFSRDRMVKPFADAVFDQAKVIGEVVGPIQTQFGFHVIKLTGIGGEVKPFDEVKAQIRQTILYKDPAFTDKLNKTVAEAQQAVTAAKDEAALKAAATKYGLSITPLTQPVSKDDPLPGIGKDKAIQDAVAKAAQGQWSEAMKTRDGIIRFKVTSVVAAHPAKFEEVKNQITKALREEKALAMARVQAQALAASAKDAAGLESEAKKAGFTAQQSDFLKASDPIPTAGKAPEVNKALLAAKPNTMVGPIQAPDAWVVAFVTEHRSVDMQKFAKDKDSFARTQRQKSSQDVMDDYVARRRAALEKENKISLNQELMRQMEPASGRQEG